MKIFTMPFILLLLIISLVPAFAQQDGAESVETISKNADAVQAIAVANQLKWSKKEIVSYVTSREVVFKFPDGKVNTVPLPHDKFFVAVAPYINRTHK